MNGSNSARIAWVEVKRWSRDVAVLATMTAFVALSGILTYLAIGLAAGDASSSGSGIQLQSDTVLNGDSTNDDLISMARSSLTMLVPIAAIVVGVQFAGSELASGALLQMGVAVRRLRYLFTVRIIILTLLAGFAGAAMAGVTLAAANFAIAQTTELSHLTAWDNGWRPIAGAAMQAVVIAVIAFSLSALTRRWVVVIICMLIYLIGLEPVMSGLVGDGDAWLPRTATSEFMFPQPNLMHALPTAFCALLLAVAAVMSLRRNRVIR